MKRSTLHILASVAALALIPLACTDSGPNLTYPVDHLQHTNELELRVDPKFAALNPGESLQMAATIRTAQGIPTDPPFAWESSDPYVAAIDGEGRVEALGPGETLIILRWGAYEAHAMIEVLQVEGLDRTEYQ